MNGILYGNKYGDITFSAHDVFLE